MGFLNGIFRSRDKPENRTAGSPFAFYLGSSTSGKYVTERSAMQMTAVYSCVRILSEAVAVLPLQFYRHNGDGGKEKAADHPLYFLLHDEPNPGKQSKNFIIRWNGRLSGCGAAFFIQKNQKEGFDHERVLECDPGGICGCRGMAGVFPGRL